LQDATGDVWVDWRAGRFTLLRRPVLAHAMARSAFLLLTGPHRFGPAALAQWLDSNGESVGVPPIASAGSIAAVSWARLYRIRGAAVAGIPTLITTSALARLSDPVVRRLGSVVITGSASAVMAAQGRVRVLTGVVPAAMVSPR